MEHLSLEIFNLTGTESKYATMEEDASITITDTSEIFASGDVWSYSFRLNVLANAHIFGTAGDMHGARLHENINKRKARLWVEGLPLYFGYLKIEDEVEVDDNGNVDVTFESGQKTFDEKIEGAKANQVPMMSDILIGMALWRKRWTRFNVKLKASARINGMTVSGAVTKNGSEWFEFEYDGEEDGNSVQEYPRMVFPKGKFKDPYYGQQQYENIDCLNTDMPYDDSHPYCNIALCYQRTGYERKDKYGNVTTDYGSEPEAQRGYEYMPANRVNSAPNFYVIYWIRALMKHLGIHIDENQMMEVEDLRRLFFVNTNCAYDEPRKLRTVAHSARYGKYLYDGLGRLIPEYFDMKKNVNIEESGFKASNMPAAIGNVSIRISDVKTWTENDRLDYIEHNSYFHKAYATSDCFPDVDISEVINAIEKGFGVRFLFSDNYKRVRIVLLRNIFRNTEVQEIKCDIISEQKVENSIRGFRMTYGDTDDTSFYYKGFADLLPHKKELWIDRSDTHDYSHWNLDADYMSLINKVSAFDMTCYVTKNTGNAYGIKVDKDAKRYDELHPSLFEFAGFMDAEDGDCTGEEETIETVNMGFVPIIMNDVNYEKERDEGIADQRFALFVEETMRPRRIDLETGTDYNDADAVYEVQNVLYGKNRAGKYVYAGMMSDGIVKPGEFAIMSDMYAYCDDVDAKLVGISGVIIRGMDINGHINEGYRLYLQDNYEPNDDGISPIETHDWKLTLGIMRGTGSDAHVKYEADYDDGEGNDTWNIVPGQSATVHPDICDSYGNLWDYNGSQEGPGTLDGRISLKLRAEKPNPQFDPNQKESATNRRYLEITDNNLKERGIADTLYKEYSYFIRNARIAKQQVKMELAQFLAIDKTKQVTVGNITGFIRKMQFTVSKKTGMGIVEMEIMYI